MIKYYFILFFLISSPSIVTAQSGKAKPLEIGNKWVYKSFYYTDTTYFKHEIIRDTTFNNLKYAVIKGSYFGSPNIYFHYQRADSSRLYAYSPESSKEGIIVDFNLEMGDSVSYYSVVTSKDIITLWNERWQQMCLTTDVPSLYHEKDCYIEGIGLQRSEAYGIAVGGDYIVELKSADIENKIYGDPTLLGINASIKHSPNNFKLNQNYPNPFNPTTTISYELARPGAVRLTVYNVLGQRVSVLVDSRQAAGAHQVRFNASQLVSGVYFYRLQAGGKVLVKKMVLMK